MDNFKTKHDFFTAFEALKKGANIHREGYYVVTRMQTVCSGKTKTIYGRIYRDGDFSPDCSFKMEDIEAKDWIIEWPDVKIELIEVK